MKAIKKKFGVQQTISEVGKITRIFEIISGIFQGPSKCIFRIINGGFWVNNWWRLLGESQMETFVKTVDGFYQVNHRWKLLGNFIGDY